MGSAGVGVDVGAGVGVDVGDASDPSRNSTEMRSTSRSQTLDGQQIDGSKDGSKDGDRQREPSTEHVKTKGHRRRAMQNFASSIHSRMSDAQLLSMLPEEKRSWHEYLPFIGELLQPQKPQRASEAIDKGFDSKLRTESRMLDHPQRLRWCAAAARLNCRSFYKKL